MSELSVFIDESGDVGVNSSHYFVTFVFHDQSHPIDRAVTKLGAQLRNLEVSLDDAIHANPLIRRKEAYTYMEIAKRKKIFFALFNFAMNVDVTHATLAYRKSELGARTPEGIEPKLQARLARDLKLFLNEHLAYFTGFDRVIVYYDNGQAAVGRAVRDAFTNKLFNVDFRRVMPSGYRLFQVADLVCTLEHLALKDAEGRLTRSELSFFGSPGRLRRNYLRHIADRRL